MPSDRETLMMQVRLAGGVGYSMLLIGEGLRPSRFLVSPVNRFLGRISYSIDLCHFIVITILAGTYAAVAQASPPVTTYVICSVITMAVTVVVAWAAYAGIEKPGIAVGKVVLSRLLPRR